MTLLPFQQFTLMVGFGSFPNILPACFIVFESLFKLNQDAILKVSTDSISDVYTTLFRVVYTFGVGSHLGFFVGTTLKKHSPSAYQR